MTIDELNAYKIAYGNPLERKELFRGLLIPFAISFGFSFILYYYWWIGLIAGIVGAIYGYMYIIPQQVKRVYNANSFRERNNFINNITQILTNDDTTVLNALNTVGERASGEFKEDLLKLQANLLDASNEGVQEAFQVVSDKYNYDVIFSLFVEQLTTATIEGRTNIDTLKDIKGYHNMLKQRQESFYMKKQQRSKDFKFMSKVAAIFIAAITLSFGFRQFIDVYAHNPIGWLASGLYLIILAYIFHSFQKKMGDDSVMEVKI